MKVDKGEPMSVMYFVEGAPLKGPSMPRSTRDAWCAALRSGQYKQARKKLFDRETGGFCCLGVLKHLETTSVPPRLWRQNELYLGKNTCLGVARSKSMFAQSIAKTLADMNDGREVVLNVWNDNGMRNEWTIKSVEPKTFSEIADWIEANVPVIEDIRIPTAEQYTTYTQSIEEMA